MSSVQVEIGTWEPILRTVRPIAIPSVPAVPEWGINANGGGFVVAGSTVGFLDPREGS